MKLTKSDPPLLKLDAPFVKELASYGLEAFDDPEEITSTTLEAAKAIIEDQKTNRRDADSTKSLLAILAVLMKMRAEQRRAARVIKAIVYGAVVVGLVLYLLDHFHVIKFTLAN